MTPVELPEGWTTVRLEELLEPGGLFDGPFGSNLKTSDYTDSGVRVVRLENVANLRFIEEKHTYISKEKYTELARHTVGEGDIIVGSFVDGAVRVCVLPPLPTKAIAKADCFCVRTRRELVDRRFLAFGLGMDRTRDTLVEHIHGVTRPRITTRQLRDLEIAVPPLAEQRRIVERIEALLARVNASRERLARLPMILKRFRQSVLAAACSGELTADWRRLTPERQPVTTREGPRVEGPRRAGRLWGAGVVPELTEEERAAIPQSWRWTKVVDLGRNPDETVQIGPMSMKSSQFSDKGVPVLNVGCVQSGWIDSSKLDYLPENIAAQFVRYRIMCGDVLFTRSGTVGRCAVAGKKQNGHIITFHLLRLRPDQRVCRSRYLWMALTGAPSIQRQAKEGQIGSTRGGFNTRLLASLDVPLPPPEEQDEIVRRADGLLRLADAVERRVDDARLRTDRLARSILAKAYGGSLVPTEAELARRDGRPYEPASMLIDGVRAFRKIATDGENQSATRRARRNGVIRERQVSA